MKIMIKSLIAVVVITNFTALLPMTISESSNAAVQEQQQEQQLKFYWGEQALGAVPARFASSVLSILGAIPRGELEECIDLSQYRFSDGSSFLDRDDAEAFIQMLQILEVQERGASAVPSLPAGGAEQARQPGALQAVERANTVKFLDQLEHEHKVNSAVLFPITLSESPHAVTQEQQQEERLTFCWREQELGSISACFAECVSPIFTKMLNNKFFCKDRNRVVLDDFDECAAKLFVVLLKLGEAEWIKESAPLGDAQMLPFRVGKYSEAAKKLFKENEDRLDGLSNILQAHEISYFDREFWQIARFDREFWQGASDSLVPQLVERCNESEIPMDPELIRTAAEGVVQSSPYDDIVIKDPVLEGHGLIISPNVRLAATIERCAVRVFNVVTKQVVATINHEGSVDPDSVGFSPDSRYVAFVSSTPEIEYGKVKVVDVQNGQEVMSIMHAGRVWIRFSPDSRYMVTESKDKTVKVMDVQRRQEVVTIRHDDEVWAEFSPDSRYVVTVYKNKTVKIVDVQSGQEVATISLCYGIWERLSAWLVTKTSAVLQLTKYDRSVAIKFDPHSKYIALAFENVVTVVEASSGRIKATIKHNGLVRAVKFSRDGRYVVTASNDGTAKFVEVPSGMEIATIEHNNFVTAVKFSPDGTYVATASRDGKVKIVKVPSGEVKATIEHNDFVTAVKFSPDGTYVVTASRDGKVKIVEVLSGREIATINHKGKVAVRFSPNGKHLVTASGHTVKIVEVLSGQVRTTMGYDGEVSFAGFSPDGKHVITKSGNGFVFLIPFGLDGLEPKKILAIAVLVYMALERRKNSVSPVQLDSNGWVFKEWINLSERIRLQKQFPEIEILIAGAVGEEQAAGGLLSCTIL